MLPFLFLLIAGFLGYLANRLAHSKGRNPWGWTIATVFLLFPILILLILPANRGHGSSHKQNA